MNRSSVENRSYAAHDNKLDLALASEKDIAVLPILRRTLRELNKNKNL